MVIQQHEIDAEVETAAQTKARNGYVTQAVVVKRWGNNVKVHLGFFFENGHKVGETGQDDYGCNFEVLAVI